MTREEYEDISTYGELFDLADEIGNETILEDVMSSDQYNEDIDEYYLGDWANNNSWRQLRDILNDLPEGYDWYYRDDYGEFYGTNDGDEHFYYLKDEFFNFMIDNDLFDDDESEEADDEPNNEEFSGDEEGHADLYGVRIGDSEKADTKLIEESSEILEFFTTWQSGFKKREEFVIDEA